MPQNIAGTVRAPFTLLGPFRWRDVVNEAQPGPPQPRAPTVRVVASAITGLASSRRTRNRRYRNRWCTATRSTSEQDRQVDLAGTQLPPGRDEEQLIQAVLIGSDRALAALGAWDDERSRAKHAFELLEIRERHSS